MSLLRFCTKASQERPFWITSGILSGIVAEFFLDLLALKTFYLIGSGLCARCDLALAVQVRQ